MADSHPIPPVHDNAPPMPGFAQPVGSNGRLGTSGPRTEDLDKFPRWLATFKRVVVTRETNAKAKKPGPVVLVGTLPSASG